MLPNWNTGKNLLTHDYVHSASIKRKSEDPIQKLPNIETLKHLNNISKYKNDTHETYRKHAFFDDSFRFYVDFETKTQVDFHY